MNMRWRGRINWKDVTERVIAGIITGLAIGVTLFVLQVMFDG
ncbi:hypothetical protein LCGC14_2854650 [marine sediment metagenome]|uniref:Uncharacterized protein n=1 Tax=marine sediment metagenome TaxID=412755 RepID=A0A0F8Y7A9_9ZZZZ